MFDDVPKPTILLSSLFRSMLIVLVVSAMVVLLYDIALTWGCEVSLFTSFFHSANCRVSTVGEDLAVRYPNKTSSDLRAYPLLRTRWTAGKVLYIICRYYGAFVVMYVYPRARGSYLILISSSVNFIGKIVLLGVRGATHVLY